MAGQTTNTDILAGLNQVIQAVNDLVLNCSPNVTVNSSNSCGCGGGTEPPSAPGGEGQTAPEGFDDTDDPPGSPEYEDRICNVANMMFDDLVSVVQELDDQDVPSLLTLGIEVVSVVLTAAFLVAATGPVGIAFSVAGSILFLIGVFVLNIIDLAGLVTILNANKNDIICTFYNSTDPIIAIDDFKTVLTDGGANFSQMLLIDAIISVSAANALYHKYVADGGSFEARVAAYTGGIDCSICPTPCPTEFVQMGTWTPGNNQLASEFNPVNSREEAIIWFNHNGPPATNGEFCGATVTVDSIVEIVGSPDGQTAPGYRIFDQASVSLYSHDDIPPAVPISGVGRVTLVAGAGPFTVEINIS